MGGRKASLPSQRRTRLKGPRRLLLGFAAAVVVATLAILLAPRFSGGDAPNIPPEIAAVSSNIKAQFVRGANLAIDPQAIRITGVEVLPNRSYIVYLDVPDAGTVRSGAVYGLCVAPGDLGDAGGFIDGPHDPELAAQREAAGTIDCPSRATPRSNAPFESAWSTDSTPDATTALWGSPLFPLHIRRSRFQRPLMGDQSRHEAMTADSKSGFQAKFMPAHRFAERHKQPVVLHFQPQQFAVLEDPADLRAWESLLIERVGLPGSIGRAISESFGSNGGTCCESGDTNDCDVD
jgi:hypothetical protein